MGNSTLSNLSELALQVRDEHLRAKNRKEWLTRRFRDQNPTLAPGGLTPLARTLSSSNSRQPSSTTNMSPEESLAESQDIDLDEGSSESHSIISGVIGSYQSQLADDDKDNLPLFPVNTTSSSTISPLPSTSATYHFSGSVPSTLPASQPSNPGLIKRLPLIPISDLFNYENSAWVNLTSKGTEQSTKTELALYDLLNGCWSSNDGDDDLFEVDATMEELLMS